MGNASYYSVPRAAPGGTVFILGGGPSLAGQGVERLAGRPTIAVNYSYSVAPWATYVYAQDRRFLRQHHLQLEKRFNGRAISICRTYGWPGLLVCGKTDPADGLPKKSHQLAGRRTSLAGAISIAAHLIGEGGKIVLLGADGGRARDGRSHHHKEHPWPVVDQSWARQAEDLRGLKADLGRLKIAVINCSPGTHWADLFPVMSLSEFLNSEAGMSEVESRQDQYAEAFEAERARSYPAIDAFIRRHGGHFFDAKIVGMAEVLACPLKVRPPNWQHGRVLYALASEYIEAHGEAVSFLFLDIGTAKGFSAVVLAHVLDEYEVAGEVHSLDVMDPNARLPRNTVAELDGFKTVGELIAPFWPPALNGAVRLQFHCCPGMFFDRVLPAAGRINLAFIDGKHKLTDVLAEAVGIAARQLSGDLILFDDLQIPAVAQAVQKFLSFGGYAAETIEVNSERCYCLASKE